jgi:RNA polymerase sigma-70 factor (ECF subfamily)
MNALDFESRIDSASKALRPIAMQLTRDPEETNDLLQLTFMKAWVNKHRFDPGTNFKAWCYTIMKNAFFSDYQKKKRRKTSIDITSNQYYINSSESVANSVGADSELRVAEIHSAIEALPSQYKSPLKMYLDGYKYDEISEKLALPLGTIKSRIFLARQKLKSKFHYLQPSAN